jgi:pyruvate formate lyase activating enzyme
MDDNLAGTTGIVFDIKKFSIHDGPGIRTTVFLKGCPLACWWCHNPESQSIGVEIMLQERRCIRCGACVGECPNGAIMETEAGVQTDLAVCTSCGECVSSCQAEARQLVGREMTVREVLADIRQDTLFYDQSGGGVTFSGGEPLSQHRFLTALLKSCREEELHTILDTCGFASWEIFDAIRPYVDVFLYDLKLIDDEQHKQYTGVSNQLILSNLKALVMHDQQMIVRIPLIPGITDTEHNLRAIAEYLATMPNVIEVNLLPYHDSARGKYARLGQLYKLPEPSATISGSHAEALDIFSSCNLPVSVGG